MSHARGAIRDTIVAEHGDSCIRDTMHGFARCGGWILRGIPLAPSPDPHAISRHDNTSLTTAQRGCRGEVNVRALEESRIVWDNIIRHPIRRPPEFPTQLCAYPAN